MKGRFSRLSAAAVMDQRLSAEALRVLAVLGCYVNRYGECWPAVTTIAARLKLHRTTVQRHLRKLEAFGYVDREETLRATRGGWGRNRYGLNYPALPGDTDADGSGDAPPDQGEGDRVVPVYELMGLIESDAASHAASASYSADDMLANVTTTLHRKASDAAPHASSDAASHAASASYSADDMLANVTTTLHRKGSDAAPHASSDAALHAAQTIPLNYPSENEPMASARISSRETEMTDLEDKTGVRDANARKSTMASVGLQGVKVVPASNQSWGASRRPAQPHDYQTDVANQLAEMPGFNRTLAWEAILALPSCAQAELEAGQLNVDGVLAKLRQMNVWRVLAIGVSPNPDRPS